MPIDVIHFNPYRRPPGLLGKIQRKRPLNNFGDLIGPLIVAKIAETRHLVEPNEPRRLLAVGSIMKLSQPGDTVWGAGVNGKSMDAGGAPHLDVRAVRGPRTAELLRSLGTDVPDIYGDPALLWPTFWPLEMYRANDSLPLNEISVVPNFHDRKTMRGPNVIDPLQDPHVVVGQIARSKFVCGSSLHGIVIAEAFGIPARLVKPGTEPAFKYDDYYAGTGRDAYTAASSVDEAITMGGEPSISFDAEALLGAFPSDLWDAR